MKPILFNTQMVQAILDGRKTTTRRIAKGLKDATKSTHGDFKWDYKQAWMNDLGLEIAAPCHIGDILYVRETWFEGDVLDSNEDIIERNIVLYRTDDLSKHDLEEIKWRPSIHMPKRLARIFLKVTSVKVEKLQDITEEGARAEGANPQFWYQPYRTKNEGQQRYVGDMTHQKINYRTGFAQIWDNTLDIHDKLAWQYTFENNPWVWVIEFERIDKSEVSSNEI
ncbi:hypothetical protein [Clostridium neonatale]|uniref:hypothetical protein n=1 Tax=Clostridium neonatale TaxID=137838 RepID=UPI00291BDACD|nr:conserved hypothetical protein [Clostridium neonatale]